MTQLWERIARGSATNATLVMAVLAVCASACDRSTTPVATTDSALQRDLTLASSELAPSASLMGDTAVATAGRVMPSAPSAGTRSAAPSRPKAPKPAPAKPTAAPVVVNETPAASPPTPVPTAPAPVIPVETPKTIDGIGGTATAVSTAGAAKSIGRGMALVGKTNAAICSQANRPGDRLVAITANEVVSPDGGRLPAGTPILVEMAAPATNGDFVFRVKAVMVNGALVPVEGVVTVDGPTTKHRVSNGGAGTKIAGGAIVGAILGGIFGGGKGAAIGAAGGAAAGTVAAAGNSVTETCLPPGTALTVTLSAPLWLPPGTP